MNCRNKAKWFGAFFDSLRWLIPRGALARWGVMVIVGQISIVSVVCAQDLIGVYFDENAVSSSYSTTEIDEEVSAYITIVAPSDTSGIVVYEGRLDLVGTAWWDVVPYGGCSIGWAPDPTLVVFCLSPLPGSSHVVVAEYIVTVDSPSSYNEIFIAEPGGIGGFGPYYRTMDGVEIPLSSAVGDFSSPLAVINPGAVANDSYSWGRLKALYR